MAKVDSPILNFHKNKKYSKANAVPLEGRLIQRSDGVPTPWWNLNYTLTKNPLAAFEFGRMSEIFGEEGAGKTTFCLEVAAYFQEQFGEAVGYVDSEQRLNTRYAVDLGLKSELTEVKQPASGEEAYETIKDMIRAGFKFIINDSIAGNVPLAILQGNAEDHHMGVHARLVGKETSVLRDMVNKAKCHIMFVNQTRMKIGAMGDPTDTTGGKASKFWMSYRLRFFDPRSKKIEEKVAKDLDDVLGSDDEQEEDGKKKKKGKTQEVGKGLNIKIIKNNLNSPFQTVPEQLYYGKGFDPHYAKLDFYQRLGLIKMSDTGKSLVYGKTKDPKTKKMKDRKLNMTTFLEKYEGEEKFRNKVKEALPEVDWSGVDF